MRRLLVALAVVGLLVGVMVAPAMAITKHYVQDNDHPFVGLIAFYDENGNFAWRCTGELLSETVVLTAGHCTADEPTVTLASARIWFQQDAGVRFDGVEDPVTGYPVECLDEDLCATSHEMYNYGFNNFAGFPNIHDVGIVILDTPITMDEYATLAPAGTLDTLLKARGTQDTTFEVSGYGISFSAKQGTFAISYRERLMADEKLVNMVSANNDGYNIQLNGNGDDRGGTCSGDSGGPVFWPADSNQIVAVTSWGISNAGCRGDGWYYRIDRQAVLSWIASVTQ
jgi:hypothetical protein